MGLDALNTNGITTKIYYLIRDRATVSPKEPFRKVRRSRLLLFVVVQLLGFGATMAVTQTIGMLDLFTSYLHQTHPLTATLPAAIGFPIVILLLIPLRAVIIPKLPFTVEELAVLDRPTASPFVSSSFNVGHPIRPCLFSRDNGICWWDASRTRDVLESN